MQMLRKHMNLIFCVCGFQKPKTLVDAFIAVYFAILFLQGRSYIYSILVK
jgi:hypothetical protein